MSDVFALAAARVEKNLTTPPPASLCEGLSPLGCRLASSPRVKISLTAEETEAAVSDADLSISLVSFHTGISESTVARRRRALIASGQMERRPAIAKRKLVAAVREKHIAEMKEDLHISRSTAYRDLRAVGVVFRPYRKNLTQEMLIASAMREMLPKMMRDEAFAEELFWSLRTLCPEKFAEIEAAANKKIASGKVRLTATAI